MAERIVRVAAMADLHYTADSEGKFTSTFAQVGERADALLMCGDLVDYGLPEEAVKLSKELKSVAKAIPIVAVAGNHEFESGKSDEVRRILCDAGVVMLDGESYESGGVGFAGSKGFGGGFDDRVLEPWGEDTVKRFVHEAIDEALKLESALARLRTRHRIALLHYAPISATVAGEPPEIFPFLGSSRLEEPLNRYPVTAVFHGHAHRGAAEGATKKGIPVYNVAMKLLERVFPQNPPFRIFDLPAEREIPS